MEALDVKLRGYQPSASRSHPGGNTRKPGALDTAGTNETPEDTSVKTWIEALNADLAQLAILARRSRRLHSLCVRAWTLETPETLDSRDVYLSLPTMRGLLSMENLSVLKLDLTVVTANPPGEQEIDCHICPAIGALLSSLRALHLRLYSICPDVLKPKDTGEELNLGEAVINLSLMTDSPEITSASHSKRCGNQAGGLLQLKADMQEHAEALATRMASPTTLRVLTHSPPNFEVHSLDVLTGKDMILDNDMAWNEDGRTVREESGSESELSDEEFEAYLDDD